MRILAVTALVLLVPGAKGATTVSSGPELQAALQSAAAGDTILLNDGNYTVSNAPSSVAFDVTQPVTIRSINGPSHVTLSGSGWYIAVRIGTNNVTLDGVTVTGASGFGVYVTDWTNAHGGFLSGVVLKNLVVSTAAAPAGAGSQGIVLGASNSVVERCSVSNTDGHAIPISGGSWNLIVNNTIANTGASGIGIPVLQGDHNVIAGNSFSNIGADAILLDSSQYNYVARNDITAPHNGVTLSSDQNPGRHSIRNNLGSNRMTLSNKPGSAGIWINNDSDWNLVSLNDASGANENGVALFNSIGNYLVGNIFHDNAQGGIFVLANSGTKPVHNSIQRNYLHDYAANGGVTANGSGAMDLGFNFIAGDPSKITTPIAGVVLQSTADALIYSNVVRDLYEGEYIDAGTTSTALYLNRYFNVPTHYTFAGAGVQWDSGLPALGGNFFSDFSSANGDPSTGSTPYTNIFDSTSGHRGMYQDRYPYRSESLGKPYSVMIQTPRAGAALAVGSQKTISWNSQGCVLVDLTLLDGSNNPTAIAANYPDFGYYRWTVPAVATGAYTVQVSCKNSAGAAVGANGMGPRFNITSGDLVLLSPQRDAVLDAGQPMLVSWRRSGNVTQPVTVSIRNSDQEAYSVLQPGVTEEFVTLVAPSPSSNRVSVQVSSGDFADSTDGWMTIRSGNGQFTSPSVATLVSVGTPFPVEWVGPPGSDYVNLDLLLGAGTRNIATGLADYGRYVMLVPDLQGGSGSLRLTFYSSSGSVVGTTQSAAIGVAASSNSCDLNRDGSTNVADVQGMINEALGVSAAVDDLNHDGSVNVADVQIVINAALGMACATQ